MGVRFRSGVRFSPVQIEAELETITPGQVGPCNLDDRKEIKNILWVRHGLEGPNSKRDRDGLPPTDAAVSPPPLPSGTVAPTVLERLRHASMKRSSCTQQFPHSHPPMSGFPPA